MCDPVRPGRRDQAGLAKDVPLRRPFEFSVDPADLLDEEASEQVDGED